MPKSLLGQHARILSSLIASCTLLHLGGVCANAQTGVLPPKGPLPYRNSEPLNTPYLLPPAADARPLKTGKSRLDINLDIVNNLLTLSGTPGKYVTDFEEQRLAVSYARGLGNGQEIGVRLLYVARNGGILDNFINDWHRIFGFQGGGRAGLATGKTDFEILSADGSQSFSDKRSHSGLGDTQLDYRKALSPLADNETNTRKIGLAGRLLLKLPTGDRDALLGSGKPDAGIGLIATARPLRNLALHGNATLVLLGNPGSSRLSPRRTALHSLAAAEYLFDGRTSLVVQTDDNPALVRSGLPYADRPRRAFTFGLWRDIGNGRQIYIANSENDFSVLAKNAPDFVLSLGTRWLLQ